MKKLTFLFVLGLITLTISAQTRTIYLDVNIWANDNPVFAVHVWNTGDADAADYWLTLDHDKIYKAEIRDDATSAIFLRKDPTDLNVNTNVWAGEWNRAETSIPTDKDLFRIKSWDSPWGEWMNNGDPIDPAKDVVIKVQKPASWAGMNIWAWGSSDATFMAQFSTWPGVAMQAIGNNWYQFTVKDDATFMFNDGQPGTSVKTSATTRTVATCFTVSATISGDEYPLVEADCSGTPTEIDQVESRSNSQKVIQNGQIYIIRDGKMYNTLGTKTK